MKVTMEGVCTGTFINIQYDKTIYSLICTIDQYNVTVNA